MDRIMIDINNLQYIDYIKYIYAAAKSRQLCPTLCDPIDSSPPGSPVLGFSRQEHWSGLPFPSPIHESEKGKWSRSVVSDTVRPHRTAAYQAPPSMGFSRQEYWSGEPLPSPKYIYRLYNIYNMIYIIYRLYQNAAK